MAGYKGTPQYNSPSTWAELKKQFSRKSQYKLKELRIKKLHAEIDFSINNMVSCHIPMKTVRADIEKFKGSNIINCLEKWANITQDQFVLNIVKFCLTVEFAEVPVCQFVPPLNFSPVETEIIDAKISTLLSKCVTVNTTREPNDYVSRIFTRPKKIVIIE